MKGSLIIISFFILGIIAGLTGLIPESFAEGNIAFYALCTLLFFVGAGVGSDSSIVSRFRTLDIRMSLLPLGTILGTFAGALAAPLLLHGRSATDCLGSRFRFRLLFIVQYLHYRIQGSGTRYDSIAVKHCPRDDYAAAVAAAREGGGTIGADCSRRCDLDGHYPADYHGFIRQAVRSSLAFPWFHPGVFHTFHRHFLVHAVG